MDAEVADEHVVVRLARIRRQEPWDQAPVASAKGDGLGVETGDVV
jgi:hypothetical protein